MSYGLKLHLLGLQDKAVVSAAMSVALYTLKRPYYFDSMDSATCVFSYMPTNSDEYAMSTQMLLRTWFGGVCG